MSYKCGICNRKVLSNCIYCDFCKCWIHKKCVNLSEKDLSELAKDTEVWFCKKCYRNIFPFYDLNNEEFLMYRNNLKEHSVEMYESCNLLNNQDNNNDLTFEDLDSNTFEINVSSKYLLEEEFCKIFSNRKYDSIETPTNKETLNIMHLNCRSIKRNYDSVFELLNNLNFKFDIIAISESWFNKNDDVSLYNIQGYNSFICNRESKQGGGVVLYVLDVFSCKLNKELTFVIDDQLEIVTVEVRGNKGKKFTVGCLYRSPNVSVASFNITFSEYLSKIQVNGSICYLCGDYNINLLNHEKHEETEIFMNNLFSYSFFPLITKPSRITSASATLIDNIFTNNSIQKMHLNTGLVINDTSDHLPIFCIYNLKCHSKIKKSYKRRLINSSTLLLLKHKLEETFVDYNMNDNENINQSYTSFVSKFNEVFEETYPWVNCEESGKGKSCFKPWFSKGLKNSCKKKNQLYKQFLTKRSDKNLTRYKQYKNKLTSLIRSSEKIYYEQELCKSKSDIKSTWKVLNQVMNRGKTGNSIVSSFQYEGKEIDNGKEIVNNFNEYFSNIGTKLAKSIPNIPGKRVTDYITNRNKNTIFLTPVTEQEILGIVRLFKNKYSCGYDNVSMNVIKNVITSIVKPLVHICNLSLKNGCFPDDMKIAKILPIYKAGDKNVFSNYRPISLLSQFSKILEKVFSNRLTKFLNVNDIICKEQYGFRNSHSTELAILEMIEKIADAMENKKYALGIFVDLKKAYDTLNSDVLLEKLNFYGIRGIALKWISSYLENRSQYVCYNNVNSYKKVVTCGIPQGSILGPILFTLYINDLPNASKLLKFVLFADDTNIFYSHFSEKQLKATVNLELEKVNSWFKLNKLSLNVSKTKFIIFGNKNVSHDFEIKICNSPIDRVCNMRFLGVIIDAKLNWDSHIHMLKTKIARNIGILNKVRNIINEETKLMLYSTLILPYINYCSSIWGNTYRSRINQLYVLQKKALRIVANVPKLSHTTPLFLKYKCLKLEDIVKFNVNIVMYKAFHMQLPRNLQCLFFES